MDSKADWICQRCNCVVTADKIMKNNQIITNEIQCIDKKNPHKFEDFIEKYKTILHATNSHVLKVKYALMQMYGNVKGFLESGMFNLYII